MDADKEAFIDKMRRYYKRHRVHPFAFWKLKALAEAGRVQDTPLQDSGYAVYQNMLFAYVSSDNRVHLPASTISGFDCIVLEETLFLSIADGLDGFDISRGYKLHYDFAYTPRPQDRQAFDIVPFDFGSPAHFEQAAVMINQGEGQWMMPENIRKIAREPVFDGSLWFFAREIRSGRLVGIAISTYDRAMRETDIEWFYVLPAYHRQGVGRLMIQETIRRAEPRSEDIRVGGANAFYKRCGFVEKERHVWAAKNGFSLVAPCIQPNLLP